MNALCLFSLVKSQCILSFKASQRLRGGVPSKNWGTYIINSMHDFYCIALVFCWCWSAIDLWQVHVKREKEWVLIMRKIKLNIAIFRNEGYLKNKNQSSKLTFSDGTFNKESIKMKINKDEILLCKVGNLQLLLLKTQRMHFHLIKWMQNLFPFLLRNRVFEV